MLEPLNQFVCDECGVIIQSPDQGYLEWESITDGTGRREFRGFRIVHHYLCSPYRDIRPNGCYAYAKDKGRMEVQLSVILPIANQFILALLNPGFFHSKETEGWETPNKLNFFEFSDLARRLTIPWYEEARIYFDNLLMDGIDGKSPYAIFREENLKSIIEKYRENL